MLHLPSHPRYSATAKLHVVRMSGDVFLDWYSWKLQKENRFLVMREQNGGGLKRITLVGTSSSSTLYQQATKSNYLIHTWHNDLWLNTQMVNFRRAQRAAGGPRNCFFPFAQSLSWAGAIFHERSVFVSYISHQNYNSQGEWRSDREVWHQGRGSHLKVTFQSTQQMLPIYLSSALSAGHILHSHPSLFFCLSLPVDLFFSGFLLLSSSFSFLSPPLLPRSLWCADEAAGRKRCNKRKR